MTATRYRTATTTPIWPGTAMAISMRSVDLSVRSVAHRTRPHLEESTQRLEGVGQRHERDSELPNQWSRDVGPWMSVCTTANKRCGDRPIRSTSARGVVALAAIAARTPVLPGVVTYDVAPPFLHLFSAGWSQSPDVSSVRLCPSSSSFSQASSQASSRHAWQPCSMPRRPFGPPS